MIEIFRRRATLSLAGLFLIVGSLSLLNRSPAVLAHGDEDHSSGQVVLNEQTEVNRKKQIVEGDHEKGQHGRLTEKRLKNCQTREKAINNIMGRIATRGEKHIGVFNKIAERTQAFYVSKGLSVSNYAELVAAVNTKKAAAESAVAAVKATSVEFKCDGSDPHGAGQVFKENLRKEKAALKEYKTAVKNLIRAVKSANSSANEGAQQ